MSLNKFTDLEDKVKGFIEYYKELKRRNSQLEERLREAEHKLAKQEQHLRSWEKEREWLRDRITKVLGELESIEVIEALDASRSRNGADHEQSV